MMTLTHRLLVLAAALIAAAPAAAQYDNDRLRDEITALGVAHNLAFAPSFSPDPFVGLNAGNVTYSANLGLKYMPPELHAPGPKAWVPNSIDECSYTLTIDGAAEKTRQDYLGLLIDYEDDFEWSEALGSPTVYHANTDVKVGIYRGDDMLDGTVTLPIGRHSLRWRGQTLTTPLLDFPPWHLLLAEALENASRKAAIGLKTPAARQKAMEALIGFFLDVGLEGATFGVDWFLVDGVPTPTFGRGIYNEQFQDFYVLDTTDPVFEPLQSDFTVEATQVGGEYLRDHLSELRAGFDVTDACDRRPIVSHVGPFFMPVGQTTEITWTARDAGPVNDDGTGFNSATFVQRVHVQDTLPPIVVPPPGRVVEATSTSAVDIGHPAVFDLADVRPVVSSDAPATYAPDSRTLVTWSATDASGNSTSANQWVTLKAPGTNTAPVANDAAIAAISFDPIEIELTGTDNDLLSGRYDQLAFSITRAPENGFFVAPLFPYFIEDRRVENAFGMTRQDLTDYLNAQCSADRTYVPATNFTTEPRYITVTDDDVTYVSDTYFNCNQAGGYVQRSARVARFEKDANGDIVVAAQRSDVTTPPDQLSIDANGNVYWFLDEGSKTGRVRRCDAMLENCQSYNLQTQPASGDPTEAHLTDVPTSLVADTQEILYATDGNRSLVAYDMTRVNSGNLPAYLGYIAQPGDLPSTGLQQKDMAIDSEGNLYVSDVGTDRVYKFSPSAVVRHDDGTVVFTPGELMGWLGRCEDNLTETRACDEVRQISLGYSCTAELCSSPTLTGSGPGQFDEPRGIAVDANDVLYVTDYQNFRVQRFTKEGYFAGEAESECDGSCFVLGDFGKPLDVTVNSRFFYVLDRERDLLHVFETTPITDFDDDTQQPTQTARVTYQSDDGYTGGDSFGFAVSDGLVTSSEANVSISITRNFRPPIADEGLVFTGSEDAALDFTLSAFDPDKEDQPILAYAIESQPEHGQITGVGPDFSYTPDPDFFGTETFAFSVSDGSMTSEITEATIEVEAVNDVPAIALAAMNARYGTGFPIRIEAEFSDVDLTDMHVYGIDWGPGETFRTGTVLPPGQVAGDQDPTYIQSAPGSAILTHEATYFDDGVKTITVCASDAPGLTRLSSCSDPNVTAVATQQVTIEPMVSKAVSIIDDAPTEAGELDVELPAPIVDGETFNVVLALHNLMPNDVGTILDATDVTLTVKLGDGLMVGPDGIIGIAGGASGVNCSVGVRQLDCTVDSIPADEQARIGVNVVGDGTIAGDTSVPIMAMATSAESDHNELVGNSKVYKLTMNPTGDADGDGVINNQDAFPGDPSEQADFDLDGIGDNADPDDDNDSLPDTWERRFGLNDRSAGDATSDDDGDSLTAAMEFEKGTRPDTNDSDRDRQPDNADNCPVTANRNQYDQDADSIGDACDPEALAAALALGNLDGAGGADFALLRTDGGRHSVFLKDGADDLSILADRIDLSMTADRRLVSLAETSGDLVALFHDADGTSRITRHATAIGAQLYDVDVADSDWSPVTMIATGTDIWSVFEDATGQLMATRSDAGTGSAIETIALGDTVAARTLGIADGGNEFLVLGTDRLTGEPTVLVHDLTGDTTSDIVVAGPDAVAARLAIVTAGFTVATQSLDGSMTVSAWATDGTPQGSFAAFDTDWTLLDMQTVSDIDALALAAVADDGAIQVRIVDAADGSAITTRDYASPSDSFRGLLVSANGSASDVGTVLADAANAVTLELQAAEGAAETRSVTAVSMAPPAPPPPPPPPSNSGGGGGGGSLGWLLAGLLGGVLLARRRRIRR